MKKELQDQLFNKYPKLFAQKDLPYTQTCMCWGLDVGDGWYDIIDTACSVIQNHLDQNKEKKQVEFAQVKEKFGGLRMYADYSDDYVDGVISIAQSLSFKTCETCGAPGKQTETGWIFTLCDNCLDKKKNGVQ